MPIVLQKLAWIALGGALGAVARFGLSQAAQWLAGPKPVGTAVVNLVGCLGFGVCFAFAEARTGWPESAKLAVFVGFFGAFTTFSTYAFESTQLLRGPQWGWGAANLLVQNVAGFALVVAGLVVGRIFLGQN